MNAAPGEDRSAALALANTRHAGSAGLQDDIEDAPALRAWLVARHGDAAPRIDASAVDRIHALRDALRELLLASAEARPPKEAALATANRAARAAPGAPQLRWPATGAERAWEPAGGSALDRLCAGLAADAIELVTGAGAAELTACPASGCLRLFLRGHGRRRWCSNACGDRVRAARYYERRRGRSVY